MKYIFAAAKSTVRRWTWVCLLPAFAVCSGAASTDPVLANPPGTVSDLVVSGTSDVSATLTFTQVNDGMAHPAGYDLRYSSAPMEWGSANTSISGTCAAPIVGTAIGSPMSCTVLGLSPATSYNFQLIAFRGTLNANAVFGGLSNVAVASTATPPDVVATVTVNPPTTSLAVGGTLTLQATVKNAQGNVMPGQTITWSTDNASVATVNASGVVTGVAAGSATITATSSGKWGTSSITVSVTAPPAPVVTTVTVTPGSPSVVVGATVTLSAEVKDAQGNVMTGQTVTWGTSNPSAATVSSSGVVTGVAAGSATITATCAGKSGTSTVTVTPVPPPAPVVTTVTVAPATASIAVGATVALAATVKDAQGNVMTGQTVTWSTSNAAAATVNSSGVVTGIGAGSATITATCAGKSGTSTVTVTAVPPPPPVVTTVTVAPLTASIAVGATVALTATVKDAQGNVMTGQTITWSTSSSGVATVNASGLVTGVGAGSATITAATAGKSGTSSITVTAPPPPPPPGGTLLFQEDFENASLGSRGWYDNTSALISTAEHFAGNGSAQYRFLAGANTPTSGGAQRHKFAPSNSFYVSFYVKYSTNWIGSSKPYHPHEFYALSTLDGDYDGPSQNYLDVYIEQNYQNGGRPRVAMQDNKSVNYNHGALPNNLIAVTEDRSTGGCNGVVESNIVSECFDFGTYWYNDKQITGPVTFQPTAGPGYKNNWNFVEAYFQLNTIVGGIGQANGVIQYWFNGTLIIDRHDILFRTGARSTLQFNQFLIAPYMGDGSPLDQSMWVDNLRVATSRIP